jgi:hypothetical protein
MNASLTSSMINIYLRLPDGGDYILALSVPSSDSQRLSVRPLKWLRLSRSLVEPLEIILQQQMALLLTMIISPTQILLRIRLITTRAKLRSRKS